jgi:hypothetical protein
MNDSEIYYKKVGRKYVPISVYDHNVLVSLPKGHHLVIVDDGFKSTYRNVTPDIVPVIAAAKIFEKNITSKLLEKSQSRTFSPELTPEQRKAWDVYYELIKDSNTISYGSPYSEIARSVTQILEDKTVEMMKNPAVKNAYDEFMVICKLALENEQNIV